MLGHFEGSGVPLAGSLLEGTMGLGTCLDICWDVTFNIDIVDVHITLPFSLSASFVCTVMPEGLRIA